MTARRRPFLASLVAALGLAAGAACAQGTDREPQVVLTASTTGAQTTGTQTSTRQAAQAAGVTSVITVSIDGLNPRAIKRLGRSGAPTLHRLVRQGASTFNARTEHEMTVTLPNHTGMVTGRRVEAATGGHGVTWNDDRRLPATVHEAAGEPVESVFSVLDASDRDSALFASKTKFSLWQRSWPGAIDKVDLTLGNGTLVRHLVADLAVDRDYRFLHLSAPDVVGHARGWLTAPYLKAVKRTDRRLGKVVAAIDADRELRRSMLVMVTADHGGKRKGHDVATAYANYRVPFIVRGPGVPRGGDLYDLNPTYVDPGRSRPGYDGPQPIRNGAVANLVTSVLGLPAVPGSEHDAAQDLTVFGR